MSKSSDELDELPAPDYDRAGVRYTPRVRTVPHGTEYVMKLEDLVALLAALPAEQRERVLNALPPETWICKPGELSTADLQRELEQERARSAALDELVGEYEAQWGDEYLAKKWELKEQRAALKKPDGEAAK